MLERIRSSFLRFFKKEISKEDLIFELIQCNVPYQVASKLVESLGENPTVEDLKKVLASCIKAIPLESILSVQKKPYVILFLGINGCGKTTTIVKLGKFLKDRGKRVVIAASDTYRAAAIEQLKNLAESADIKVIAHQRGSDAAAVAYDAIQHAKSRGIDYVLIDTAGRSYLNINLMRELEKIVRVSKPNLKILVVDAVTGSDIENQIREFGTIGFDAIIVTKLDLDDKGGILLSAPILSGKPILAVCYGQGLNDIRSITVDEIIDKVCSNIS